MARIKRSVYKQHATRIAGQLKRGETLPHEARQARKTIVSRAARGGGKRIRPMGSSKMLGAHPAHDRSGRIHVPTGAKLTDGKIRPHISNTHMRPYTIPKGMPRHREN